MAAKQVLPPPLLCGTSFKVSEFVPQCHFCLEEALFEPGVLLRTQATEEGYKTIFFLGYYFAAKTFFTSIVFCFDKIKKTP